MSRNKRIFHCLCGMAFSTRGGMNEHIAIRETFNKVRLSHSLPIHAIHVEAPSAMEKGNQNASASE